MPTQLPGLGGPNFNSGANTASSAGITLTANSSINTKATTWTELISSTTGDTAWLAIQLYGNTAAASTLVDIGVGLSTAETVLIPNLFCCMSANGGQFPGCYIFPVSLPGGTRISARSQSSVTSGSSRIAVQTISPGASGLSGLGRVEGLGQTTAGSSLTAIDPGAVANTDSTPWTELIATTGFDYRWMVFAAAFDSAVAASANTWLVDFGTGASSSETAFYNDMLHVVGTLADYSLTVVTVPVSIAAGTRISARARSAINTATSRIVDVAAWGVG